MNYMHMEEKLSDVTAGPSELGMVHFERGVEKKFDVQHIEIWGEFERCKHCLHAVKIS